MSRRTRRLEVTRRCERQCTRPTLIPSLLSFRFLSFLFVRLSNWFPVSSHQDSTAATPPCCRPLLAAASASGCRCIFLYAPLRTDRPLHIRIRLSFASHAAPIPAPLFIPSCTHSPTHTPQRTRSGVGCSPRSFRGWEWERSGISRRETEVGGGVYKHGGAGARAGEERDERDGEGARWARGGRSERRTTAAAPPAPLSVASPPYAREPGWEAIRRRRRRLRHQHRYCHHRRQMRAPAWEAGAEGGGARALRASRWRGWPW
ncbi:hypothetical protein C8R45DRAFT_382634 [Mycena sanguinolenta]|nr:hypothetical protein C8R45DRAFT_382634 [Mycena sanguinolenta]